MKLTYKSYTLASDRIATFMHSSMQLSHSDNAIIQLCYTLSLSRHDQWPCHTASVSLHELDMLWSCQYDSVMPCHVVTISHIDHVMLAITTSRDQVMPWPCHCPCGVAQIWLCHWTMSYHGNVTNNTKLWLCNIIAMPYPIMTMQCILNTFGAGRYF